MKTKTPIECLNHTLGHPLMKTDLFVYGMLQYPELVELMTGQWLQGEPATLLDHQRLTLHMEGFSKVAVVVPEAGAEVTGLLLRQVNAEALELFDAFEDAGMGLYVRGSGAIALPNGESMQADTYLGSPLMDGKLHGIWDETAFKQAYYADYRDRIIPEFVAYMKQAR